MSETKKSLRQVVPEYDLYLKTSHAPGTRRSYLSAVTVLTRLLGRDVLIHNLTAAHVDRYVAHLQSRGCRSDSVRQRLTALRAFCRWAKDRRYAPQRWDPVGTGRRLPAQRDRAKLYLPVDRFSEALDCANEPRVRAIISFALYTLCRQNEIFSVKVGDLDLPGGDVDIYVSKSDVHDRMPISTELDAEMRRWLLFYERACGPLKPHWLLFPAARKPQFQSSPRSERGWIMPSAEVERGYLPAERSQFLGRQIHAVLDDMGIDSPQAGMHTFRRSGARALFDTLADQGYDRALRMVQATLHHKSGATTERYLGLDREVRDRDQAIRGKAMYGGRATPSATLLSAVRA